MAAIPGPWPLACRPAPGMCAEQELDIGGPEVLLFDDDGQLLEAIDMPGFESTVEFQV